MGKSVEYIYPVNPFYVHLKKHFCPKCGTRMIVQYNTAIANNKKFSSIGFTHFFGDVEYRTPYFHCKSCGFDISVQDMKKTENGGRA